MKLKKFGISLPLLLIATCALIIRLVTLPKLMVFTPDEAYILYIVQTIVKDFHIIWIGVSALGFDFYMGPGWMYFLYPFIAIFKGDPLIPGIITSLFGVATAVLLYWIGKRLFNLKVGILASLLYATSALMVYYDQQPYPPGVPLLSLLILISLYLTKHTQIGWIIFAFLYGLVFHIHLSLVLILAAGLYWFIYRRKSVSKKTVLLSVVAFLIAISPLIVFDFNHNFSNTTAPLRVAQTAKTQSNTLNLNYRAGTLLKSFSRLWYLDRGKTNQDEILYPCNTKPSSTTTGSLPILVAFSIILLGVFLLTKNVWKDDNKRLLLVYGLSFLIPFLFLPAISPVEYYLLPFFPVFFVIVAYSITILPKRLKYISYLLLIVLIIHNVFTVLGANGDFGINTKKTLINKVMLIIGDAPYELSEIGGPCQGTAGWRYLFLTYSRKPERSSEDRNFSWLWTDQVSGKPVKYSVVMAENRAVEEISRGYTHSIQEGGFTAYIYEY